MEDAYREFNVEEDLVVGMVPLDCWELLVPLEPLEDLSAFVPAVLRRSSLKKGIATFTRTLYHQSALSL